MFAPAVARAGLLPDGYKRLEYIETTGSQYINTGISGETRWVGKAQSMQNTTKSQVVLGGNSVGAAASFVGSVRSDNLWTTWGSPDTAYPITQAKTFDLLFTAAGVTGRIGETVVSHTSSVAFDMTWKICWHNSTYPFIGKLFYFKAYQNDVLVRNFVPVQRISDSAIGMYDTVNGVFYPNKGTGSFAAGPEVGIKIATKAYNDAEFESVQTELTNARTTVSGVVSNTITQTGSIGTLATSKQNRPTTNCPQYRQCMLVQDPNSQPKWFPIVDPFYDLFKPMIAQNWTLSHNGSRVDMGYTQLDYIQSSGTQWIDTGVVGDVNTKVDIDFTITGGDGFWPFGSRKSASVASFAFWSTTGNLGSPLRIGFDGTSGYTGSTTTNNTRYRIIHSRQGTYLNDNLVWNVSGYSNFTHLVIYYYLRLITMALLEQLICGFQNLNYMKMIF